MIRLTKSLSAWGGGDFKAVLKSEIEQIDAELLPLQEGLTTSSYALDSNIHVMIMDASEINDAIRVKVGIFYTGVIAGCSCADDPTPVNEENEYCEVELVIEKPSAKTRISLITD